MKYPNAAKGINKIYIAEILSIIGAVLAIVMVILAAVNHVNMNMSGEEAGQALQSANISTPFVIYGILMTLVMLVAYILNLIGIINASKDEESFKRALWVLLASIALSIVASILETSNPQVANWLKVPSTLFELVVMIYVLEGISNLAKNFGKTEIVDMCTQCRTWFMCALILSAAAESVVAVFSTGSTLNTASGIAAGLLQIIAYVLYLRVLNKARLMQ